MVQANTPVGISYLRSINQRRILEAIEGMGVTSRTELSQLLQISKPAVSDNLSRLIEMGLVTELEEGVTKPNGGRKPVMLQFNKNRKFIIAVDLNNADPVFVMCNLNYEIIREFNIHVSRSASSEAYVAVLLNGISLLLESSGRSKDDVIYIAIASPGVFDGEGKLSSYNADYSSTVWCTMDLKSILEERFHMPVLIKNDIKAAALGEWCLDKERKISDMMYIGVGLGIGIGIILDGQLYEGKRFNAGEIFNYTDREKIQKGLTLEKAICLDPLVKRVQQEVEQGLICIPGKEADQIEFSDVVKAFEAEEPRLLEIIRDIACDIGILTANSVNLMSIERVVIGGEYIVFGKVILEEFEKRFKSFCCNTPEISLPAQGKYSGVMGMVYLAKERYFDHICSIAEH